MYHNNIRIVYSAAYVIVIVNHKFISLVSDNLPEITNDTVFDNLYKSDYESDFNTWKVLQIVITVVRDNDYISAHHVGLVYFRQYNREQSQLYGVSGGRV